MGIYMMSVEPEVEASLTHSLCFQRDSSLRGPRAVHAEQQVEMIPAALVAGYASTLCDATGTRAMFSILTPRV